MTFDENFKNQRGSFSSKVNDIMGKFKKRVWGKEGLSKSEFEKKYDYTSYCEKKRISTTIDYVGEAKQRFSRVFSESQIEAHFAFSNSLMMRGGYNYAVDFFGYTTLSAAIWILDDLALHGKMEALYPLLPKGELVFSDIAFPPVSHPFYDTELIYSLAKLIRYRNSKESSDHPEIGTIMWEHDRAAKAAKEESYRKEFDAILELMDQDSVKHAITKYEEDVWSFYRLAIALYIKIDQEISRLEQEKEQLLQQLLSTNEQFQAKRNPLLMNTTIGQKSKAADIMSLTEIQRRIDDIDSRINWLYTKITMTDFSLPNDREKTMKLVKTIIPSSLRNELVDFHVDDPYETAFALVYLLDSDSHIPWLYYGSISVAYTMYDQLPYDTTKQLPKELMLLSDWNKALYQHRYKGYRWDDMLDADDEPVQREYAKNLSQLFYASSSTIFPRVVPEQPLLETFLGDLGELTEREKEAYSLLLFMLNSAYVRFYPDEEDDDSESTADASDIVQPVIEQNKEVVDSQLITENTRLREKNSRLTLSLRSIKQLKKLSEENLQAATIELNEQRQELADLRELIFLTDLQELVEEPVEESIHYPYLTSGKILSFGGHPSWIKEMKKRLPKVIYISPDTVPNTDLIRSADSVWLQTNCISHSDFYKIIGAVRANSLQLRYFTSASPAKCAEQIVKSLA